MKKILLSILTLLAFTVGVNAQNVNVPDANFKAYLVGNAAINTNSDTEIQVTEAIAFSGNLNCSGSFISDMTGIEAFTSLTYLWCFSNPVTSLDLSNNTALEGLRCSNMQLTSLDLTNNSALTELICHTNQLTSLDISNNTSLMTVWCYTNQIGSLNLSNNSSLTALRCEQNQLTSLDVANGNNAVISIFNASNNPNLTCIKVDDDVYSTANWTLVDAQTSFDTNCSGSILVSSIDVQGQGGTSSITSQGGTLQMEATVLPANADDRTYTWSVVNGTGTASISASGLLTAMTNGTVDVIATANDASGVTGTTTITISNQDLGLIENGTSVLVELYPNPVQKELFVQLAEGQITQVDILDFSGKVIQTIANYYSNGIDVSSLNQGVYLLKVFTENGISTNRFIKQ